MSKMQKIVKQNTIYPRIGSTLTVDILNQRTGQYDKVYIPHVWMSEAIGIYLQVGYATKAEADMAASKFVKHYIEEQVRK